MAKIRQSPEAEKLLELPVSYEERGIQKGIIKVAKEMLRKGMEKELIAELTGLSLESINELNEHM